MQDRPSLPLLLACLLLMFATGCGEDRNNMAEHPEPKPEPSTQREQAVSQTPDTDTTIQRETPPPGAPLAQKSAEEEWTAGIVSRPAPQMQGAATMTRVRAARHEDYDRAVFEFEGDSVPGYHIEYIDRPVRKCGSGDVVELMGDGWLEIRMQPARAHTEAGEATITERARLYDLPVLKEMELTCDFEAVTTWVLGVSSPNRYRVMELSSPARLVVDIRHTHPSEKKKSG